MSDHFGTSVPWLSSFEVTDRTSSAIKVNYVIPFWDSCYSWILFRCCSSNFQGNLLTDAQRGSLQRRRRQSKLLLPRSICHRPLPMYYIMSMCTSHIPYYTILLHGVHDRLRYACTTLYNISLFQTMLSCIVH